MKVKEGTMTVKRAKPHRCKHRVIQEGYPYDLFLCVSCDSTVDKKFMEESHYEYDVDYNVFVYIPKKWRR